MNSYKFAAKLIAVLLSVQMVCSMIPLSAYASEDVFEQTDIQEEETMDAGNASDTDISGWDENSMSDTDIPGWDENSMPDPEMADTTIPDDADIPPQDEADSGIDDSEYDTETAAEEITPDQEEASLSAFEQSVIVDTAEIAVKAPEGTFPEGAQLSVQKASDEQQVLAEEAVDRVRDAGRIPVHSYTYEVRILDAAGEELHLAEGQMAEVSFALPEAFDESLTADIWHIRQDAYTGDLTAEKLDTVAERAEGIVHAKTDGFSLYTVEFSEEGQTDAVPEKKTEEDQTNAASEEETTENISDSVEFIASSNTNNIVGQIFANWVNGLYKDIQEESLAAYPLDPHEREYYGDSLRVRDLAGKDGATDNFLVYRDTYLIISEEESAEYEVGFSADGTEACITPAIPEQDISGKTGIIFLREDVSCDDILVFAGEASCSGDSMTVPVRTADQITVNELFSDGQLGLEQQPQRQNGLLKASSSLLPDNLILNKNPEGNNWKGTISNFSAQLFIPTVKYDLFKLLLEMDMEFRVNLDFDITTTGSSGGETSAEIAKVHFTYELFSVSATYRLETEFDSTPIRVRGSFSNYCAIGYGTHGTRVRKFNTPVTIDKLDILDPSGYNKDIRFYIGTGLYFQGGFLEVDIPVVDISYGPLVSINMTGQGGCNVTARHEKDQQQEEGTSEVIHSCANPGKEGCLALELQERHKIRAYVKIDLFFDSWDFDLGTKDRWVDVGLPAHYYNTYTFRSGMREGYCPHKLYKLPVAVWQNTQMQPAANMDVSVAETDRIAEEDMGYACKKTDSSGKTVLYLPISEPFCKYTVTAGGELDGNRVYGTQKSASLKEDGNPQVDVYLHSGEKILIKADIDWHVDLENREVPYSLPEFYKNRLLVIPYRRVAGSNGEWELVPDDEYNRKHYVPDYPSDDHITLHGYLFDLTDTSKNWAVKDWEVDKYGFKDGRTFTYEYRVRLADCDEYKEDDDVEDLRIRPDWDHVETITQEENRKYIERWVGRYINAAGDAEPDQRIKYLVGYDDQIEYDPEKELNEVETRVALTSVVDVDVNKRWNISDPDSRPDEVYLTLLQMPEDSWFQIGNQQGTPNEWLPIQYPIEGSDIQTMASLRTAGVLSGSDHLGSIENVPLTVGKAGEENNWKVSYTVPRYRNGVKMQFCGAELSNSILENLLDREYWIWSSLYVSPFGNYYSVNGPALRYSDTKKIATVVNSDPLEENTIMGTVSWENAADNWSRIPDSVRLTLKKNGKPLPDVNITLSKEDYAYGQDVWTWTKKLEDYDPSAEYTVEEEPNSDWVPSVSGLHVYNRLFGPYLIYEVQAVFDVDPPENINNLNVELINKSTQEVIKEFDLQRDLTWYGYENGLSKEDYTKYTLLVPLIPGYREVIEEPYVYFKYRYDAELPFVMYTVHYYRKSTDLKLRIHKEWDNNGDEDAVQPDQLLFQVYRDNEQIAEKTMKKNDQGEWPDITIDKDRNGKNLYRVDAETGHKYIYTVEEMEVEGYTSEVTVTDDSETDTIEYTVKNTWSGKDYVNVSGKVNWEGDSGHENLRPLGSIAVSVLDAAGNRVRTVYVKDDMTYEAKYLPAKDKHGNAIPYSVVEEHINGYTITYSEPKIDYENHEYNIDITNTLTGYFPLTIRKTIKGSGGSEETFRFRIHSMGTQTDDTTHGGGPLPENASDLTVSGAGDIAAEFLFDEPGVYFYTLEEEKGSDPECQYDESLKLVVIARTTGLDGKQRVRCWVGDADETDIDSIYAQIGRYEGGESGEEGGPEIPDDPEKSDWKLEETDIVEFINVYPNITIKKEWDIDLEKKDRPESIYAAVQEKKNGQWTTVQLVELSEENDWTKTVAVPDRDQKEYRVRELQGETVDSPVVYDKADSDQVGGTPNEVTYYVKAYVSALEGGMVDSHNTKYRVSYSQDGSVYTIKNKAILEIDVIKRWIGVGVDDEDMPDSAWVVLMFSLGVDKNSDGVKSALAAAGLSDIFNQFADYELPVFNWDLVLGKDTPFLLEGGKNPLTIINDLVTGLDLLSMVTSLADGLLPSMAIARVTKDDNWRVHYVVSKYALGLPVEFKGAELGSEIIRQILKYVTGFDIPLSYNPFDKYISIPTKAIRTILGMTDIEDIGKIPQQALNRLLNMSEDEWRALSPESALDDWHLMANVINLKIDWDTDPDDQDDPDDPVPQNTIYGKKTWDDNDDAAGRRPDTITVILKADGVEVARVVTGKNAGWKYFFPNRPVKDENGKVIQYTITEKPVDDYQMKVVGYNITNTYKLNYTQISVNVKWDDRDDQDGIRPKVVTVKLLADGSDTGKTLQLTEAGNWAGVFTDLYRYKNKKEIVYSVEEVLTDVITGTDAAGTYAFRVSGIAADGYTITNTHTPETRNISVEKNWDDDSNKAGHRPESIVVRLRADGQETASQTIRQSQGSWKYTFRNVPVYKDGQKIHYSISEDAVDDYVTKISGNENSGFVLTNTYRPARTQVTVHKVWSDDNNRDGKRPPAVTVSLLADGRNTGKTLTLSETNGWNGTFTDLDNYRGDDQIVYTVEEEKIDGYALSLSGSAEDGYVLTNTHVPEKTKITVKKIWNDADDQDGVRPEKITVRLRAGGRELQSREITADDAWACSFENLYVYENGRKITYTVSEDAADKYTTEISGDAENGFTITNTHTPANTQVSVHKVWNDEGDLEGFRPESVAVRLLADGIVVRDPLVLSETNNWSGTFKLLDKYEKGREISYTVEEAETDVITGDDGEGTYAVAISGDAASGYTVTNTHTPERIEIPVDITWEDDNNRDGIRPDRTALLLLANGTRYAMTYGTAADGWEDRIFNQLPKYQDGTEIKWELTENKIDGYTVEITGNAEEGFHVVNTHIPEKTSVKVTKVWEDYGDQDGNRPEKITVRLRADGRELQSREITADDATADDVWECSFEDLYVNENGRKITYTVSEDVVDGYTHEISGDADQGFTITNAYTPEYTQVSVHKVWDDMGDREGFRPESVTVRLLADGTVIREDAPLVLSEENSWSGTFKLLDKYEDGGKLIEYTVEEVETEVITGETDDGTDGTGTDGEDTGHTGSEGGENEAAGTYTWKITGDAAAGYTITNTHTPTLLEIPVEVEWEDDNDRDGIRPDRTALRLLADRKQYGMTYSTAADGWKERIFKHLPKYQNGTEIRWSLTEDKIDGYTINIYGNAEDGFRVVNTHIPEKTSVEVTKVWDDYGDQDGNRPDSITVRLRADGLVTETKEISANIGWKASFTDLYVNENGRKITYTVSEDVVDGYTHEISGDAGGGFIITNHHTPEYTQVSVHKVWDDMGDIEGLRPESVTVRLLADGTVIRDPLVLSEANNWAGTFTYLDKYDYGREIEYTVEEAMTDVITGEDGDGTYAVAISGDAVSGYTVSNVHTPKFIEIPVDITWDDDNDRDGIRPKLTGEDISDKDYIRVRMLANGEQYGMTFFSGEDWKDGNTAGTVFVQMPRYLDGQRIVWEVKEDDIGGYTITFTGNAEEGFHIVNTHIPEKTKVTVTKIWKDALDGKENADGIRPDYVTVKLLADGKEATDAAGKPCELKLGEDNNWQGEFTDLYVNEKGKPVSYTPEEVKTDVITGTDGKGTYASSVTYDEENGFAITNTHTPEKPPVPSTEPTPEPEKYTITYDLNGGRYMGSPDNIIERYPAGTEIRIHEAPERTGYTFQYWKGSEYQPGDRYTVTEDHIFTAQWKLNTIPSITPTAAPTVTSVPGTPVNPENSSTVTGAKTGDNTAPGMWLAMLAFAGIALAGLSSAKNRRRRRENDLH